MVCACTFSVIVNKNWVNRCTRTQMLSKVCKILILVTRMAHRSVREFNLNKKSIIDFKECLEFYCTTKNFCGEGEHAQQKRALFIILLGQETFTKLKILASPMPVSDLTLDAIMEKLLGHYRPQIIKIAERVKVFKRSQKKGESITKFMAKLWQLAKTCNFGDYLDIAIRYQFI